MPGGEARKRSISTGSRVWLAFTALLLGVGAVSLLARPDPAQRPAALPAFDLQGHRGARGLHPENSLPGIEAALAIGVTTLEMDLGMTRDGVIVVHHDRRLDPQRTRGPDGAWIEAPAPALVELDFARLGAYDVGRLRPGSRAAGRFPGQQGGDGIRIPALGDVIALAEARSGGRVRYNLEIKTSPLAPAEAPAPAAFAAALVAFLRDSGVADRTAVQSFDWRALAAVQAEAPEIPTAYLTAERKWLDNLERGRPGASPWTAGLDIDDFGGSVPRAVKEAGGRVWAPYFRDLRDSALAEARRLGLKVVVWTVNDPADMASLIDLGVDGIITDYPDRLRRVMEKKGLTPPPRF